MLERSSSSDSMSGSGSSSNEGPPLPSSSMLGSAALSGSAFDSEPGRPWSGGPEAEVGYASVMAVKEICHAQKLIGPKFAGSDYLKLVEVGCVWILWKEPGVGEKSLILSLWSTKYCCWFLIVKFHLGSYLFRQVVRFAGFF